MYQISDTLQLIPIPAFKDNYIWVIGDDQLKRCIVIDPGEATPVLQQLQNRGWDLSVILITHHHNDHTAGVTLLKETFPDTIVYAPHLEGLIPCKSPVREKMTLSFLNHQLQCKVYEVPGHTIGHVVYFVNIQDISFLFAGDTLFRGGCGRLLEGTPRQLYHSLLKLRQLPAKTLLCPGHEYTLSNLKFAHWLEPTHIGIQSALHAYQQNSTIILPSSLHEEYITNPFLKCDQQVFIQNMQKRFNLSSAIRSLDLFWYLRALKDSWPTCMS